MYISYFIIINWGININIRLKKGYYLFGTDGKGVKKALFSMA